MSENYDDRKLVEAYLRGDRTAVNQVDRYIAAALSVWQRRLSSDADDSRSDVHLKLLISLKRGDFDFRSSLNTYISRIVSHTSINYLRLQQKMPDIELETLPISDKTPSAESKLERKQLARITFRVIRMVPSECRQLWHMYLKQDLGCRQIGEIMGKSEGNIRRRLWECRETAKEIREKILKKDKLF